MSWGCWLILNSFFECIWGKCRALCITVRATPAGTEHTEGNVGRAHPQDRPSQRHLTVELKL